MTPDQYLAHLQAVYASFRWSFASMPAASAQELISLSTALEPLAAGLHRLD